MSWDWSSPIALGLFIIMASVGLVLVSMALAVVTGKAKVADLRFLNLLKQQLRKFSKIKSPVYITGVFNWAEFCYTSLLLDGAISSFFGKVVAWLGLLANSALADRARKENLGCPSENERVQLSCLERFLAKEEVESQSLFTRTKKSRPLLSEIFKLKRFNSSVGVAADRYWRMF